MQSASTSVSHGFDLRVVRRDLAEDGEEQAVGVLHDVRLRDARHATAAVGARVVEREADDPLGALRRERLDRDPGRVPDLLRLPVVQELDHRAGVVRPGRELDPGVQVLGVLADDDEVDGVVPRPHTAVRLAGADARVQAELVAQRDVDRPEARADRGGDRPLQGDAVPLDRFERRRRQRRPLRLHHVDAGFPDVPREVDAGRLEHTARRLGELRPGAVAGDQGHCVRHRARRIVAGRRAVGRVPSRRTWPRRARGVR